MAHPTSPASPTSPDPQPHRRRLIGLGATAALAGLPALAQQRPLPRMTEGPFYPSASWRKLSEDWDADLTQVRQGGQTWVARGEHMSLGLRVISPAGLPMERVAVEIWQCDTASLYRHPSIDQNDARLDPGFQGFGAASTDRDGQVRFRTIKPVPYPGRTPHVHLKLELPNNRELTTQLFISGDPGNGRDGLWRRLGPQGQEAVGMVLQPAQQDNLRWQTQHTVVLEA